MQLLPGMGNVECLTADQRGRVAKQHNTKTISSQLHCASAYRGRYTLRYLVAREQTGYRCFELRQYSRGNAHRR